MTTAVDEANADDDCPKYQLVANSVYEQYTDPKSGLHALTVTHWVGEDSWFKCLDFINPMEVAALGADGLRWATNEVMSTEVGTSISVLKDGEPHVTFHLDTEGNLISLSPWSDGAPGELIDGEQFLQSLDNERHPLLNELAEYVRQQSPSVEDKDCECPE